MCIANEHGCHFKMSRIAALTCCTVSMWGFQAQVLSEEIYRALTFSWLFLDASALVLGHAFVVES